MKYSFLPKSPLYGQISNSKRMLLIILCIHISCDAISQNGFTGQTWTGAWGSDGVIHVGDLNGDSKTDVFMWRDASKSWMVNISNGTGFSINEWKGAWGSDGAINVGDLNGDGKMDVFMWKDASKSWMVNLSTGDGFNIVEWTGAWGSDGPIHVGDLNGDKKTDVFMWRDASKSWMVNLSSGAGFSINEWKGAWGSDGPIHAGDLNGDGRTDIFMWRDASKSWTVNLSTGTGFDMTEWKGAWGSDGPINVGDLNGDGKTDVFMWKDASQSWMVNLSSEAGFTMNEWKGAWGSDGPISVGDLDGNGKTDVAMWRDASKSWMVNLSTGTGFNINEWKGAWGSDGPINVGDLNGDGRTDIFMWRPADNSWTVNIANGNGKTALVDEDKDGLDDGEEQRLLNQFRPYYKFSLQDGDADKYRPTDVLWYIRNSEILTTEDEGASPIRDNNMLANRTSAIVFDNGSMDGPTPLGASDISKQFKSTQYHVNPLNDKPGRVGAEWREVLQERNIGLYGHVVPIKLVSENGVLKYDRFHVAQESDPGETFYKIEYWQFFGYNACHNCPTFDHEGDWITVQLLYNPTTASMESVFYYMHGALEIRFDMKDSKGPFPVTYPGAAEKFMEYQGNHYKYPCYVDAKIVKGDIVNSVCSNNFIRFCEDVPTQQFTHPVVYIENGSHEPWPTWEGFFAAVPNHNGDDFDHSFLTSTPGNLGEVEHPLKTPGAYEILTFNGRWGAKNDGAKGPSLHTQWTWPAVTATTTITAVKSEMDD